MGDRMELEEGLAEVDDFLIFEGDNVDEVKQRQLSSSDYSSDCSSDYSSAYSTEQQRQ